MTTTFNGLETFTNAGLINLRNGVPGNQLVIGSSSNNTNFVGQGGSVALSTALGGD